MLRLPWASTLARAQDALFFALPFAVAITGALVMLKLAARQRELELDSPLAEVKIEGNQSVAALFDFSDQAPNFLGVHQQLSDRALDRDRRASRPWAAD